MPRFRCADRRDPAPCLAAALLTASAGLCGCASSDFEAAFDALLPDSSPPAPRLTAVGAKTGVIVGVLEGPPEAPLPPPSIAEGLSDEVARMLLDRGAFDVWLNPRLSAMTQQHVYHPAGGDAPGLAELRRRYPNVQYLITGRVTDFVHTADLPDDLSRRWLLGRRYEAVVGIDFRVVEMDTQRVLVAERVIGRAPTDDSARDEEAVYGHVAFGSHLFWRTPLGKASRKAVEQMVTRAEAALLPRLTDPRIVARTSYRRVRLDSGSRAGLRPHDEYHLYTSGDSAEEAGIGRAVMDPATNRPVVVRIDEVKRDRATAWLIGAPPRGMALAGLRLRRQPPATTPASTEATRRSLPPDGRAPAPIAAAEPGKAGAPASGTAQRP